MCFSPSASFIASASLATIAIPTYVMADKKEKILATVPFMFAIQQGIEGFQWLALSHGGASMAAGYAFLFFALLVWPIYIPFLVFRLDATHRHILQWFIGFGVALSFYFLWILFSTQLSVNAVNQCIVYHVGFPEGLIIGAAMLYIFIVSGSLMLSSQRFIQWFGMVAFFSSFIAAVFYFAAFISVWCFFAAILSSMIFLYVYRSYLARKAGRVVK